MSYFGSNRANEIINFKRQYRFRVKIKRFVSHPHLGPLIAIYPSLVIYRNRGKLRGDYTRAFGFTSKEAAESFIHLHLKNIPHEVVDGKL